MNRFNDLYPTISEVLEFYCKNPSQIGGQVFWVDVIYPQKESLKPTSWSVSFLEIGSFGFFFYISPIFLINTPLSLEAGFNLQKLCNRLNGQIVPKTNFGGYIMINVVYL